ncbi:MAG: hypothetical protein K8Q97_04430 [Candidatus Andersenbacteria bacterium]|nr:hypothetical protein [Candidatus Andersenbacteria bacterium]
MNRLKVISTSIIIILIAFISIWAYTLSFSNPTHSISKAFPWPIACSTRGCITSQEWSHQRAYDIAFAAATGKTMPSDAATLTTIIRRHLITHAEIQSPISLQDAVRYRTAILHTTDISTLRPLGITSFADYDSNIILPFLEQEALMKQRNITNTDDLYKDLAHQRTIILLLFHYHWNIDRGEVEAK